MMHLRHPSPALVIAVVALFVSLSGTAVAAGVVPLAKRALTADKAKVSDNAKKLGGKTAIQITSEAAAKPGPASSAAGLITVRTTAFSLNPDEQKEVAAPCAAGEKAISGGYSYTGSALVMNADSTASADGASWVQYLMNFSDSQGVSGSVQAICLK
jgi:hypothetical protein